MSSPNFVHGFNQDGYDVLGLNDYAQEIKQYNRQKEQSDRIVYSNQNNVTTDERQDVIEWMWDVCQGSKLLSDTYFRSVNVLDRFMSHHQVKSNHFYYVGMTALWIACKVEEVKLIPLSNLMSMVQVRHTKKVSSQKDVLRSESLVLKSIDWNISTPLILMFLKTFCRSRSLDAQHCHYSQYLVELALTNVAYLNFLPSQLAAAAIWVAVQTLNPNPSETFFSSESFISASGYRESDLVDAATFLIKVAETALTRSKTSKPCLITQLYAEPKFSSVSLLPPAASIIRAL